MSLNTRPATASTARYLALLVGCLLVGGVGQAQVDEPNLEQAFAWDYSDQHFGEFNVVRFEVRIDAGPPSAVGIPILPGESQSYSAPIPVMPIGQHALEVRACSSTTCGAWSEPMLFVFSPPFVVEIQRRFGWPGPYHQP